MKCIHCGKEIIDGSNFCKFCGKQQNLSSGEQQIVNVQRKSSTAKVLNIFTIISLIVSMVVCFTPLVVSNNFYVMPAYFFNDSWTFCYNSSQKLSYVIMIIIALIDAAFIIFTLVFSAKGIIKCAKDLNAERFTNGGYLLYMFLIQLVSTLLVDNLYSKYIFESSSDIWSFGPGIIVSILINGLLLFITIVTATNSSSKNKANIVDVILSASITLLTLVSICCLNDEFYSLKGNKLSFFNSIYYPGFYKANDNVGKLLVSLSAVGGVFYLVYMLVATAFIAKRGNELLSGEKTKSSFAGQIIILASGIVLLIISVANVNIIKNAYEYRSEFSYGLVSAVSISIITFVLSFIKNVLAKD